jgi:selenide, water dikinase
LLFQLLAGAVREFEPLNVVLAGGHTIEGLELSVGFTIIAEPYGELMCTKSQLAPGDVLILTKPLGTGVLLAAHKQARCPADGMEALLSNLLASNESAIIAAVRLGARAATDASGFGLATHLLEMLRASGVDAEIEPDRIPMLPYAAKLLSEGVESTLAPANRKAAVPIWAEECDPDAPEFRVLFDPQTNGGLLLALPVERAHEFLESLPQSEFLVPRIIGRVTEMQQRVPTLRLLGRHSRDPVPAESADR